MPGLPNNLSSYALVLWKKVRKLIFEAIETHINVLQSDSLIAF